MRVDGKLGGFAAGAWRRGRRCAFAGGSVWTSLGHLVGLTPVRNKSETQCYHDLRRPGSAVRMFMRPFVWAECAQHIHVNVLPGCFQISRANPKPQEAIASEERVRLRNTLAPFVRVRCAAKRTIMAYLERRAVHMEPRARRLPHVMSVHRASLACRGVTSVHRASPARGRCPPVTSVHRASLARGRFPHVTNVHRASLARGRFPGFRM